MSRHLDRWRMALLLASLAVSAERATAESPTLDRYVFDSTHGRQLCSSKFRLARAQAESLEMGQPPPSSENQKLADYRECIRDRKRDLKISYSKALGAVRKPAARDALKEHYVATVTALDGIEPVPQELLIDYQRRQATAASRVQERWSRFEIER